MPADLDCRATEGNFSIKRRQSSDHPVPADHGRFDHLPRRERNDQRYDGVMGKMHRRYGLPGLEQNLVLLKFERPEMWLKKLQVGSRKGCEQQVGGGLFGTRSPASGGSTRCLSGTDACIWIGR